MKLFLAAILLLVPTANSSTNSLYGQAMVHTADGATYVITGDLSDVHYDYTYSTPVVYETISNAVGLPPAAMAPPAYYLSASGNPPYYGQISLYTADGRFYTVTGGSGATYYLYHQDTAVTVLCTVLNDSLGLPPATNDIIFKDGFEHADFCFAE